MPKIEMGKQYKSSAPDGLFKAAGKRVEFDRILTIDAKLPYPVWMQLKDGTVMSLTGNGYFFASTDGIPDLLPALIEVTPYSDFNRGEPVMVSDDTRWIHRHFSHELNGQAFCFSNGESPWTTTNSPVSYKFCRRPTPEELAERGM